MQFQFATCKCTIGTTDGYECGSFDGSKIYDGAAAQNKWGFQRNAEQADSKQRGNVRFDFNRIEMKLSNFYKRNTNGVLAAPNQTNTFENIENISWRKLSAELRPIFVSMNECDRFACFFFSFTFSVVCFENSKKLYIFGTKLKCRQTVQLNESWL